MINLTKGIQYSLFKNKANFLQKKQLLNSINYWFSVIPHEKKVHILYSDYNNIHFNLATEEYLYEHSDLKHPTLFLWRNDKTIVIGRHQNPWKECFIQNMERDNINLARRRTGGGAVYQDLGNSCFSFLTPIFDESLPLDSKKVNNKILLQALKNVGLEAEFSGRNDLLFQGRKISGSAYQINLGKTDGTGKKALHHGTMLLNVDTQNVKQYLNPNKEKLKSKGVDSVISRIINLQEVKPDLDHKMLCDLIEQEFINHYQGYEVIRDYLKYESLQNQPKIKEIYTELKSWDWIYGHTPQFTNTIETRFDWGIIDVNFQVNNNIINACKVWSDCLYADYITRINQLFSEHQFTYDQSGMQQVCHLLKLEFFSNPDLIKFTEQLEEWLKRSI
ncbi:hypothetical protein ABPG72_008440 [Tetrahymena utriculariae]